ncbi:FAD-dependent oxidoreductase [Fimbriiglobus ruber]|nr:FAD-dependent oxidoreductase [Fimbriiglobus ruber]
MKKRLAIIGNRMATGRLLDELSRRNAGRMYAITVFGEEPHGCYNRILLGRVLSGGTTDEITLKSPAWYAQNDVTLESGVRVEKVDTVARQLVTTDSETHSYDAVVFATGSAAFIPKIDGLRLAEGTVKPGVFVFRTVADCTAMRAYAHPAASAVVVGGGLLGLEAAKSLCDLGLHVTVLQNSDTLMNAQLDKLGGDMLRRAIEKMGIYVRTGVSTQEVIGDDKATAVRLSDGSVFPAELVVLACGIAPRTEVAKAANVPVKRAIVVNDRMSTAIPGVYAVGECAEHDGKVYGLVEPIWDQCGVLADVLTAANPRARYTGSKVYARLKVVGVEVASMGLTESERDTDEVIQVIEDRKGIYRKLIVRDGKLAGAMLVGSAEAAPVLIQLYDRGDPLPPNRLDVLASPGGGLSGPEAAGPEVCNCHHVTEGALVEAIKGGCTTLPMLSECTKAGTGCGSCRGQLANLLLKHAPRAEAVGANGVAH